LSVNGASAGPAAACRVDASRPPRFDGSHYGVPVRSWWKTRLGAGMGGVLALLSTAAGWFAVPAPSEAIEARYRDLAIVAINSYDGPNSAYPQVVAYDARARAVLYGWDDPLVARAVRRLDAMRTSAGGWGIAGHDTTYTITTAGPVGMFVIEAYRHGLVDLEWLVTIRDVLLRRIPRVDGGNGLAYSLPVTHAGHNVYNVTAKAALWLYRMMAVAPEAATAEARTMADRWAATIEAAYSPALRGWAYSDKGRQVRQDGSHNAAVAEAAAYVTGLGLEPAEDQIMDKESGTSAIDYGNGVAVLLTIPGLAEHRRSSYRSVHAGLRLLMARPKKATRTRMLCTYAVHLAIIGVGRG
jgi:hypothetical protein